MNTSSGWIGVDLDGTLAIYNGWGDGALGEPVGEMLFRVKKWIADGRTVKIFTARVGETGLRNNIGGVDDKSFADEQRILIQDWCEKHIGMRLEVTAQKDFGMIELWDDRAVQVEMNTGRPIGKSTRNL